MYIKNIGIARITFSYAKSGYDYEIGGLEVTRDEKGPITRMNKQKPKERKTSSKRVKPEQKIQSSLQHL